MITYATPEEMLRWATSIMEREPDICIGPKDNVYLRRWWVVPRNEHGNVYLHEILRSDDDRALHDHPWPNQSLLIEGRYIEHTPAGSFVRERGWTGSRSAEAAHRLEVIPGERVVSLFITGPKIRDWGFHCPKGWVHWQEFTAEVDGASVVGRGCGEMS